MKCNSFKTLCRHKRRITTRISNELSLEAVFGFALIFLFSLITNLFVLSILRCSLKLHPAMRNETLILPCDSISDLKFQDILDLHKHYSERQIDTNFIEEYFWKTKSIPYTIFEKNETIKSELREILNETLENFQKDINSSLIEWNEIPCNTITSYDRYVVFNLADPSFPCGLSEPSSSHQNTIQFSTKSECDYSDHLIHILSILGFISSHLRQDRDNFVNIHFENIFPFYHQLFDKCENCMNSSNNAFENYDYDSILHLPKFSRFTINKSMPTITEKTGNNLLPISYNYTGRSLSTTDIAIIKAIYL